MEPLEPRRVLAAGDLDPSFGDHGVAWDTSHPHVYAEDAAMAPDGKSLIVAGDNGSGDSNYVIQRFAEDGSVDPTFGDGGIVSGGFDADVPVSIYHVEFDPAANGKFYALATVIPQEGKPTLDNYLARFNADGSLDTSLSGDGWMLIPVATATRSGLAVADDGRIYVAVDNVIRRFTNKGEPDAAFGGGDGEVPNLLGEQSHALHALPGGGLLVGGSAPAPDLPSNTQFALIKLKPDGSLDTAFGVAGKATAFNDDDAYGLLGAQTVRQIDLLPGGKILVTGDMDISQLVIGAARFTAAGVLDTTFGAGGTRAVRLNRAFDQASVDSSGRIYLSGSGVWGGGAIARLTPDGAVDETFGRVIGAGGSRANGQYLYSGFLAGLSSANRLLTAGEVHIDYSDLPPFVQIVGRLTDDAAPSPIEMNHRVVSLTGTSGDDDVYVAGGPVFEGSDDFSVMLNGFGRLFRGSETDRFDASGGDGDDFFTNYLRGIPCHIAGGNGGDRISGTDRNDTLDGGAGRDFLDGGDGADRIVGGGGSDRINGQGGADHLYGRAGNDGVVGGGGNDYIDGGAGRDLLIGGAGNDVFLARDSTVDVVIGGAGADSTTADDEDLLETIENLI